MWIARSARRHNSFAYYKSLMSTQVQNIWKLESGITDFEVPWQDLAATELKSIQKIWSEQKERLKGSEQLVEFSARLRREWAIETGIIENLYQIETSVTRTLIERGFHAEFLTHGSTNRPVSFVINLLKDQESALEGVFDFIAQRRALSLSYIKELHAALVRSQTHTDAEDPDGHAIEVPLIKGDWKKLPNFPVREGVVYSYCPPEHVAAEMERLVQMHKAHTDVGVRPEVESAWLHHRFSQIHPFQDGNGRVARALASMILVKSGLFPLVVTRNDKARYLAALESADQGSLKQLVELFTALQVAQFRKATALSENILASSTTVSSALDSLKKTAEKTREARAQEQRKVFEYAKALEEDAKDRLEDIAPGIAQVLISVSGRGSAFVTRSNVDTDYFYRAQIIENARNHLDYFADTTSYRSWVTLNMQWKRKARLVFAFHAIGHPFSGSLVCAPFFEFRDSDEDQGAHFTIVPVTDEAFLFFYNESLVEIRDRFRPWREKVIAVTIKELEKSL